jgi:hypothetical protein
MVAGGLTARFLDAFQELSTLRAFHTRRPISLATAAQLPLRG